MKIALGCDHRGGKVAYRLTKDVFLRNHYATQALYAKDDADELVGAFLIDGASCSDDFDGAEENDSNPVSIYELKYGPDEVQILPIDKFPLFKSDEDPVCVDYPDVGAAVAQAVAQGRADMGVLICGTGVGMCITANKFKGVRAAVCFNEVAAELSRRHNDANVLCVSGEFLSIPALESLVRRWLITPFDGGRHEPRVQKISDIERQTGL